MSRSDDPNRAWLPRAMAEAVGVSLTDALAEGRITEAEFGALVERCRHCDRSEPCLRWRLDHPVNDGAAPPYCLNAELIETLRVSR